MDIFIAVLGLLAIYSSAFLLGKGLSKIRLPAILGWLIAGMVLGPCLGGLVSQEAVDSTWYKSCIKLLEGLAGVTIGAEVIFKDLKKYGAKTTVITLFQSLGAFLAVSAAFLAAFLVAVSVNLGMPLDYRYIAGSGVFTLVYILSRAAGKIGFASLGGAVTKSEKTVTKYLGLTLLPHSGVSLIFTGIAASTLAVVDPSSVSVVQGTIASAAVLNEIFAVLLAQLGLKKAGEIHVAEKAKEKGPAGPSSEDKGNA